MTNEVFSMFRCKQCGVVFTNYFSTNSKNYYSDDYYAHTARQEFSYREKLQLKSLRLKQGHKMPVLESYVTKLLSKSPEPVAALSDTKKYLKNSGLCIVNVPNFECNERSVFGMYWRHIDVPRHLYHFSPRSLEIAGKHAGLMLVEKRYKFWGLMPDKASYKMFKEREGIIGHYTFLKCCLMQFFSLLTLMVS